jgi:class 3 adenylate cyclase
VRCVGAVQGVWDEGVCPHDNHCVSQRWPAHRYATDPRIAPRFEEGYSVKMGFGLHVGWAIEGAIGSSYKIDASYLSPHVNMASRLEAATKQFRTPLLLSADFHSMLSPPAQHICRCIDVVTVKGSEAPMGLFACDISDMEIGMDVRVSGCLGGSMFG